MAKQEKGNWKPVNVKAIVNNVNLVFKSQDIGKLNKPTYEFIINDLGFIAHYNLQGFQSVYRDLRLFAVTLRTSEYSKNLDYNLAEANRQATDDFFKKSYGEAHQTSVAQAMIGIIEVAQKHFSKIKTDFDAAQKEDELRQARMLAARHGYVLRVAATPSDIAAAKSEIDRCESCRKCGETTCGNDTKNYECFEPKADSQN